MQRQGLKIRLRTKKKRSSERKARTFPPYLLEVYKLLCTRYKLQPKEKPESGFRLLTLFPLFLLHREKKFVGKRNSFQV